MDRFELHRRQQAEKLQAERHARARGTNDNIEPKTFTVAKAEGTASLEAIRKAEDTLISREAHERRVAKSRAHTKATRTRNDYRADRMLTASEQAAAKMRAEYAGVASKPLKPYLGEEE